MEPKNKYVGIFFIFICSFWSLLFFISIQDALADTALELPINEKIDIMTWMPQGWGFFSKDPREELTTTYNLDKGELAGAWPNLRKENYFGLKRLGRSQSIETGIVLTQINPNSWAACDENPLDCLEDSPIAGEITNTTPNANICGQMGLVQQEPIPWAWSKKSKNIEIPSKIVKVEVKCSKT